MRPEQQNSTQQLPKWVPKGDSQIVSDVWKMPYHSVLKPVVAINQTCKKKRRSSFESTIPWPCNYSTQELLHCVRALYVLAAV